MSPSTPQCTPAQSWTDLHIDSESSLVIKQMDLEITRRNVSSTPVVLIPGDLPRSMRRLERSARKSDQLTMELVDNVKDRQPSLKDRSW